MAADGGLGKLTACYEDCSKYYGDNLSELQSCRSFCDAMWRSSTGYVNLSLFERCFPYGILELKEFGTEYRRIGRFGFDDRQIVGRVSYIVGKMIDEGKERRCPDINNAIIKAITSVLDELGIDRYSISKADLHGMRSEVRQLIMEIFPSIMGTRVRPSTRSIDLSLLEKCFHNSLLELKEFEAEYKRIGRFGFEDWQIVNRVSLIVSKMLNDGKERNCPNLSDTVFKVIVNELGKLGIDRYSISKADLHGMNNEVRQIILKVFPNITEIKRPASIPKPASSEFIPVRQEPLPLRKQSKIGRRVSGIAALIFIIIIGLMIIKWITPSIMKSPVATITITSAPTIMGTVTSTTISTATSTTTAVAAISTTITTTTTPQLTAINPSWVNQFISIINQYRANSSTPPLQYCPWLSNFAQARFNTMIMNPAISHYGYESDFKKYLSQYQGALLTGEEVLFPSGYTPSEFVQYLINNAPIHWNELMDSSYAYYGYYIGYGPNYVIIGSCPVTEIPGPNINIPQYFQSYGCQVKLENVTWFVIELSNWCSGPVIIPVILISFTLDPQYYEYIPIQYSLPTNQQYAILNINVTSTGPVRFFVFTPDQYSNFSNLLMQQLWNFTGPAYYYGGESKVFEVHVELSTEQLDNGGYYLVISNVLPNATAVNITINGSLTYTPQAPNIPPS